MVSWSADVPAEVTSTERLLPALRAPPGPLQHVGDLVVEPANLTDVCSAGVTVNVLRKPASPPKFDGRDVLTISDAQPANLFGGIGPSYRRSIASGHLFTTAPAEQQPADVQQLTLNLPLGDSTLPLPLRAAHVEGAIDEIGIMSGRIHGVISKDDVNSKIIPAVATLLTQTINKDPNSGSSKTIIMLFEDMTLPASKAKCMVANDCCATNPITCKITPDEVKAQPLIGNFLGPDVQVFEDAGAWKPVPRGTNKNGLSVGLGFGRACSSQRPMAVQAADATLNHREGHLVLQFRQSFSSRKYHDRGPKVLRLGPSMRPSSNCRSRRSACARKHADAAGRASPGPERQRSAAPR